MGEDLRIIFQKNAKPSQGSGMEWNDWTGMWVPSFFMIPWMPKATSPCCNMKYGRYQYFGKCWFYFHSRWRSSTFCYCCSWMAEWTFSWEMVGSTWSTWVAGKKPDLTPCDFFLWGWLKEQVYSKKPTTLEELEGQIRLAISAIPQEFLERSVQAIPERLEKLQANAGAYIEF